MVKKSVKMEQNAWNVKLEHTGMIYCHLFASRAQVEILPKCLEPHQDMIAKVFTMVKKSYEHRNEVDQQNILSPKIHIFPSMFIEHIGFLCQLIHLTVLCLCKYSRVYTLSKYADKMLTKNLKPRTVIGKTSVITCKMKVKFHKKVACCGSALEGQPQVNRKSAYI